MSSSIQVFIDTSISLNQLVEELSVILNLEFEFQKDEFEEWFFFRDKRGLFTFGTHDYENDRNMFFENYKYEISFWENPDNSAVETELSQSEAGRMLFDKIKETQKYPIDLMRNKFVVIATA
jgi:hypothetical protein